MWPFKKKEVKLCKDCRHCKLFSYKDIKISKKDSYNSATCLSLHALKILTTGNLILGKEVGSRQEFCNTMRASECGKRAKYFRQKIEGLNANA